MTNRSALLAVGTTSAPPRLTVPTGRLVWLDVCEGSVLDLVQAIQGCLPTERLTVVAAWPEGAHTEPAQAEQAMLMTEVATGVAQSLQFELGAEGTTANVVVVTSDQVEDLQTTVDYFHGADGGFVAGCTFDLRRQGMRA